jgi:predicted DNA-binding protein
MPKTNQHPKGETFNFRVDPALKAAFTAATEADDRPAAQVLRDFMRIYVKQKEDQAFAAEAHRQSLAIAARSRDPGSDDHASLTELEVLVDEDAFRDEWKA